MLLRTFLCCLFFLSSLTFTKFSSFSTRALSMQSGTILSLIIKEAMLIMKPHTISGRSMRHMLMPLARMAMYAKGVQIYLAPTADARDAWQATLRHIACEGRCFVLGCNQYVTKSMYPPDLDGIEALDTQPEMMCRGGSAIISPLGEVLAGPLYDDEGILYADLDLAEVARSKFDFDVVGHYARPDVFQLVVNERPMLPTTNS